MATQNDNVINLGDFVNEGEHVLVGREKGKRARIKSDLEKKARQFEKLRIIVPDGIYAVNPSFLVEFLRPVVSRLGEKRFQEIFDFECQGPYDIRTDLEESVRRIIREPHVTS